MLIDKILDVLSAPFDWFDDAIESSAMRSAARDWDTNSPWLVGHREFIEATGPAFTDATTPTSPPSRRPQASPARTDA